MASAPEANASAPRGRDAARIGGDTVHPNQPPTWEGLTKQARSTLAQLFVHNLARYNDPDTLLVGTAHSTDAARVAATIVALPGRIKAALAPRSNLLLAVHPLLDRPQFLATDRHITQGGTCLRDLRWDAAGRTLSGVTELVGNHTQRLFFHVPAGFAFASAQAHGTTVTAAVPRNGAVLTLTLTRRSSGTTDWRLRFAARQG